MHNTFEAAGGLEKRGQPMLTIRIAKDIYVIHAKQFSRKLLIILA
jgi:hypothetical protein